MVEDLAKEGEASGRDPWREDQKDVRYPQSVGMVEKSSLAFGKAEWQLIQSADKVSQNH